MTYVEHIKEREKLRKHVFNIKNNLSLSLTALELKLLDELVNSIYQLAKYESQGIVISREKLKQNKKHHNSKKQRFHKL